ncbi:hypothetical protein D3C80_1701330 [compost metagenome]
MPECRSQIQRVRHCRVLKGDKIVFCQRLPIMGLAQEVDESARLILCRRLLLDRERVLRFVQVRPIHGSVHHHWWERTQEVFGLAEDVVLKEGGDFRRSLYGGAVRKVAKAVEFDPPLGVSLARSRDVLLWVE